MTYGRTWYTRRSLRLCYSKEILTVVLESEHRCWSLQEGLAMFSTNKTTTPSPHMETTGIYSGLVIVVPAQLHGLTDRRYVVPFDSTVVPPAARIAFRTPDMLRGEEKDGNHTRVIYPAFSGTCTASLAISLRGARKALYKLSMQPNSYPVDIGLRTLCQGKDFGFTCVAPYPSIIGWYRPAGNTSQYGDIETYGGIAEEGQANGLMFSTRVNIDRLLKGETSFKSSFPDVTGGEVDINEITIAVGHYETVQLNPKYQDLSSEEIKQIPWDSEEGAVE